MTLTSGSATAQLHHRPGHDQDLTHNLTVGLEPEDGLIWVYGIDDDGVLAFTDEGIEEVRLLIEEYDSVKPSKP